MTVRERCEDMTGLLTSNRILAYADRLRAQIKTGRKPDGSPIGGPAELAALDETLNLTHIEWFAYQNAQARAHVTGKLTTEEAQTVYMALGGEGMSATGWAVNVDLAIKVTITNLMGELVRR